MAVPALKTAHTNAYHQINAAIQGDAPFVVRVLTVCGSWIEGAVWAGPNDGLYQLGDALILEDEETHVWTIHAHAIVMVSVAYT